MKSAIRYSKQRENILKVLSETKSHPTAEWLYQNLKKDNEQISLATIYRNLKQLRDNGDILSFETRDHIEHYDAWTDQHYHFVCEICHQIHDLDVEPIKNLDTDVEKKCGHKVREHSLIFYGECENCKVNN